MELNQVERDSRDLLLRLIESVPGDLGVIVKSIVQVPDYDQGSQTLPVGLRLGPLRWVPRILALSCAAYNQPIKTAIPVGVALQLLGIVSSVLDATQDDHQDLIAAFTKDLSPNISTSLRSRAALISNAGVSLIGLAWQVLLEQGPHYGINERVIVEIGQMIAQQWQAICHAQHQDLTIGRTTNLSLEDYERIVMGKAGEIGGTAGAAAAILAGVPAQRHHWQRLTTERTLAHQLADDFRDLENDLSESQQMSAAILYGLTIPNAEQQQQVRTLLKMGQSEEPGASIARQELIQLLKTLGAEHYVVGTLVVHCRQALRALYNLELPPPITEALQQWVLDTLPIQMVPDSVAA